MNSIVAPLVATLVTFSVLITACNSSKLQLGESPSSPHTQSSSVTANAVKAIPLGVAFSQTSNYALLGQESVIGAQIAEQCFNDKGGINGTPIKRIFQDTIAQIKMDFKGTNGKSTFLK